MILDGRSIIDKMYVTYPDALYNTADQEQPNGLDLRVHKIYNVQGKAVVPAEGKVQTDFQVQESPMKDGKWQLNPQRDASLYYADFRETASLKAGVSAQIITRSSLIRSGVDVVAGWWDTGWEGRLGCCLRVWNPIEIQYGARLAQLIVHESRFNGVLYNGRYNGHDSQTAILYT